MIELKETGLIPQNLLIPEKVFQPGGSIEIINFLKEKLDAFVPNIATGGGRDEIRSFAASFSKSKTACEKAKNWLTEDVKAKLKLVNDEWKIIKETCDEMRDKAREPLTKWEEEQEKIRAEEERIELERQEKIKADERAKQLAIEEENKRISAELKAKEAELNERQAKIDAENKAKLDAEIAKINAENKAKLDAERAKINAENKAKLEEQAKIDAENKAKLDAERLEMKIKADAIAKKEAEQRKFDDEKTVAEVKAKSIEQLAQIVSDDALAELLFDKIAKGELDFIKVVH